MQIRAKVREGTYLAGGRKEVGCVSVSYLRSMGRRLGQGIG